MFKQDIEIKLQIKDTYRQSALFWIELANDRLSEISKQFLGLAAILLPLSASIVLSHIKLTEEIIVLLISAWVFLFISILAGLKQLLVDTYYFKDLSNDSSTREKIYSDFRLPLYEMNRKTQSILPPPTASTHTPIIAQGIYIALGLYFIMLAAVLILLNNH